MKKLDEMNAVGGIQGAGGNAFKVNKKAAVYPHGKKPKDAKKKFTVANLQETVLRQAIRTIIFNAKMDFFESKSKTSLQETKLRKVIRSLLAEASDVSPYNTTGLNVASETMKRIERTVVDQYKSLTSSLQQRQEYLKAVLDRVRASIKRQDMMYSIERGQAAGTPQAAPQATPAPIGPMNELDMGLAGAKSASPTPALPIKPDQTPDQKSIEVGKQIANQVLKGIPDTTGGARAIPVVTTIVPQILSARDTLKDEEDRRIFDLAIIGGDTPDKIGNIEAYCNDAEKELQATNGVPQDQAAPTPEAGAATVVPPMPPAV